jgi:hypothetical protein
LQDDVEKVVTTWSTAIHKHAKADCPDYDPTSITVKVTELMRVREVEGMGISGIKEVILLS